MKELTPMQLHILDLQKIKNFVLDKKLDKDLEETITETIYGCIENAESHLPKEKQVIENSYEQGKVDEETIHPTYSDGQDYYNTKYNN